MTVARSQPDHNRCVAMHGKPLGISEVRGQMASGGQTMGQIMWTRKLLGSNHVDTGVAAGQRGSKRVDTRVAGVKSWSKHVGTGVAGGQSMWWLGSAGIKACGHGSRWGSNHGQSMWNGSHWGSAGSKHVVAGVSGGQIMLTREWLRILSAQSRCEKAKAGYPTSPSSYQSSMSSGLPAWRCGELRSNQQPLREKVSIYKYITIVVIIF